jgi:hydrogenase maturation protease
VTGAGVLVVGYGNSLRGDDGVGWHAAGRLAADPRLAGARVLARHQLTPELAVDVAQASLVVLVDAVAGAEPREILVRRVQPRPPGPATWSHHLDPETLAGLAEALYGEAPPVVLVGVGAGSLPPAPALRRPGAGPARARRGGPGGGRRRAATTASSASV